jgi:hypothetical protein
MNPPKIKLCDLYRSFDPQGRPFLKGRLGDTRVIVVERGGHEGEGVPTHEVWLIERNFRQDARRLDATSSLDATTNNSPKGDD